MNSARRFPAQQAEIILKMFAPVVLGSVLMIGSCGYGGSSCIGETPVPKLSAVSPDAVSSQSLPASIILKGSGFVSWSKVYLNSVNLSGTTLSSNRISAEITWQDLSAAGVGTGTVHISVTNPGQLAGGLFGCPNGGDSGAVPITIE